MPKQSTLAKGFARGLTADLAGVAGDTANNMANLLRAGFGYAGHKLGMLKAEDMPELVENKNSPFTSDWLAKNTPLEDTGEEGYTAARIAGGLAPMLAGFAKGSLNTKPSAPGAMDERGILLMPESMLSRNGLNTASDATLRLPSGTILRPAEARPDLKLLADMKQNPREEHLGQLYPALAGKPDFLEDRIATKGLGLNLGGYHSPLESKSVLNSNKELPFIANTLDHEITHGIQAKAGLFDVGSNTNYFKDPDRIRALSDGARYAEQQGHFPGENLSAFQRDLRMDPFHSYKNSEGEITARIAGGAGELMSQGGSQVPHQQLLDALTRREGGFKNANIRLVLKNLQGGDSYQTHAPAHLAKTLTNRDGDIYDELGNLIGYSPAYR